MTYKQKMEKEHPIVDKDFVLFSCPGHYFDDAPHCNHASCPGPAGGTCSECWGQEIPTPKADILEQKQVGARKTAARVKELYNAFRDEGLNHEESFDITKIVIAAEVQYDLSKM